MISLILTLCLLPAVGGNCRVWLSRRHCVRDCDCAWCVDTRRCLNLYEVEECREIETLSKAPYCVPEGDDTGPLMGILIWLVFCCVPCGWCLCCAPREEKRSGDRVTRMV